MKFLIGFIVGGMICSTLTLFLHCCLICSKDEDYKYKK